MLAAGDRGGHEAEQRAEKSPEGSGKAQESGQDTYRLAKENKTRKTEMRSTVPFPQFPRVFSQGPAVQMGRRNAKRVFSSTPPTPTVLFCRFAAQAGGGSSFEGFPATPQAPPGLRCSHLCHRSCLPGFSAHPTPHFPCLPGCSVGTPGGLWLGSVMENLQRSPKCYCKVAILIGVILGGLSLCHLVT